MSNYKVRVTNRFFTKSKIIALVFVLGCFFVANYAYAATLNELQDQQNDLDQQIQDKKSKITVKETEIGTLEGQISELDGDISTIESKISDVESEIQSSEESIEKTNADIEEKQRLLNNEMENQAETIRTIYESFRYSSPIRMIIGSSTLSQLINYNSYLEALENKIESTIDEINTIKKDLESEKEKLEKQKIEQESLKEQQKAYKRGLEEEKGTKDNLLNNKEYEKQSLEQQIAEAKEMQSQVEAQIAAAIAASRQGSGISAKDKGVSEVGFMWPADGETTCFFGESTPFQSAHSGHDIANVSGTPIYAAASGTVTTVAAMQIDGHYYGYGNYIIIGHNSRFSSLYGHLSSFAVSAGAEVTRGQVIGYMGSTGWSTGPHLHFEIREYGVPKDPLIFLP